MTNEKQGNELGRLQEYEFDSMNLQVGSKLQLISHRNVKPVQYFSTAIGYVKDEYILIKLPVENGFPVTLREGEKLTVRVFSGINVCSFVASVIRIFLHPFFYVHLSFPESIQGTSLRTAMRVKVNIPAEITEPEASENASTVPVLLSNLSVAGALIESVRELNNDQKSVGLSFTLTAQPGNHEVRFNNKVSIRNANMRKATSAEMLDTYMYGVQFVDLDPTHQIMLQNLTYEALIGDRQKIV